MVLVKVFLIIIFISCSQLFLAQHTIKVRKAELIEGLYQKTEKNSNLPTYFYYTKAGKVYYTFSKKLKSKRALVKLTLCAMDSSCREYPRTDYIYKDKHIRFTTVENVDNNYFLIYDGQLSNENKNLSIRKEETNQLIKVAQYELVVSKK